MNRQIKKVVSMILAFVLAVAPSQIVYAAEDTIIADLDSVIESNIALENSDDPIDTQIAGSPDNDLIEEIIIEDTGDNPKEMESEETDTDMTENSDSELAEIIIGEDGLELDLSDAELASEISMTVYDVLGLWEGNYTESINGILVQESIRLVIEECTEDGKLNGTAIITSENNEEYYFEGAVEFVTGSIVFEGADLLENPDRPIFPLLSGILHLEDMTINGVVDEDENKPFTLSKVSYDYATMSTQTDSTTVIEAPDYDTWLANTMLYGYENSGNGLYTTFQSFSEPVYMELGGYLLDDVPLVSMSTAWSVYFNSEYRNQFANEQKYIYEVILMEYLKYDSGYKAVKNELMNNEIKFSMKLYKTIAKELSDNTLDYINNMTVEEAIDLYKKTDVLDKMGTAISELKDGVDSVKDLINVFSEYMALQQVRDERVYLLRAARNACASSNYPNSDFIKAADELINIIEGSTLQYVQGKSLDYLWEQGCDYAWGKLCDANPILKSIELGVSGLNVCFDSTDVASNNLKLALLYTTDHYLKQGMMSATSNFMSNDSPVNAQTFLACFQAYIQFQMYGNDFAKTWLNGYLDSGVVSNFVNMIFYRENISTAKELIDRSETQTSNRKNILQLIDKYANMYQHLYGDIDWKEIAYDANISVTGVSFSNPQVTLINKSSIFLAYANIEPSNATNKNITYTSSDPSILSVPENGGFATVKGSGTVTVQAKTEEGGFIATQTVTVGKGESLSTIARGNCGTNARWKLFDDGTLYIYGSGEMDNYSYMYFGSTGTYSFLTPWWDDRNYISKVILGDEIKSIGQYAFVGCSNLKKVVFGEEFQTINRPDGVITVGGTFKDCTSFVEFEGEGKYFKSYQGILYSKDMSTLVAVPSGKEGVLNVKDGTEVISKGAFWWCGKLTSVYIPESVLDMYGYEYYEFKGCEKLQSIEVSDLNVNYYSIDGVLFGTGKGAVGKYFHWLLGSYGIYKPYLIAYPSAKDNTVYSIPQGVKSIEPYAFYCVNALKKIIIPDSMECLYKYSVNDCKNINNITFSGDIPDVGYYNISKPNDCYLSIFSGVKKDLKIHMTENAVFKNPSRVWIDERIIVRDICNHNFVNIIDKVATCDKNGEQHRECTLCGMKEEVTLILATGHKYGLWETTKTATVLAEGEQKKVCSICGKSDIKVIAKLKPTIKLTASSIQLKVKQSTTKIKVTGLAKGDAVKSWKSNNTKIVKVSSNGKITAQSKTGKATITVTLKSGLTKKITVKVQKNAVACTKVTLNKSSVSLKKGKSFILKPTVKPITCVQKIKYSSSNKKVATVSSKGKITAKKKGKATITVTVGKKKVKCKVTVK